MVGYACEQIVYKYNAMHKTVFYAHILKKHNIYGDSAVTACTYDTFHSEP